MKRIICTEWNVVRAAVSFLCLDLSGSTENEDSVSRALNLSIIKLWNKKLRLHMMRMF